MKKTSIFIIFLAFILTLFPIQLLAQNVPKNEYSETIQQSKTVGIIPKESDNTSYQSNITRLEIIQSLVRVYELVKGEEITLKNDVAITDTNDLLIKKAVSVGIVSPDATGKILPNTEINREGVAYLVFKTSKLLATQSDYNSTPSWYFYEEPNMANYYTFKDLESIAPWSKNAILFCLDRISVMTLNGNRNFMPYDKMTREEAFKIANDVAWIYGTDKMLGKGANLPAPKLQFSKYKFNRDDITISWLPVKGAKKYKVELFNSENTKIFDSESSPNLNILDSGISIKNDSAVESQTFYYRSNYQFYNDIEELKLQKLFGTTKKEEKVTLVVSAIDQNLKVSPNSLKFNFVITKFDSQTELYFGEPGKTWFVDKSDADKNMTNIKIDVWKVKSDGTKYASTASLTVHKEVANDIKSVFKKIFEGDEKFPIKDIGAYAWRGNTSQHNLGLAIDINPNENYMLENDGITIRSGKLWAPGENIYSITPDGEVVRAFEEIGWGWGDTYSDYMHFSHNGN